ncbi:helicase DnaB [Kaistia dalseonensis]|uniref:DNA 5'-3' helicase n=1 Tax=Kaistia dalseonensis TaxID=410840 RepID=A0ABU0H6P7_9HYPH|nr:DnaB-like helicase C-terminal domain-containing protein [Kaistia dalseonensis]MCX5495391.1 helicase DnaB [Kaistia dalseonensis]MDQ0437979.1 replicative DNA helicase [Kaistia dalseonensis]
MNQGQPGTASRLLPQNIDVEQALLGAILLNNKALDRVAGFLEPEHFAEPVHGQVFDIATKLIRSDRVASPVTLKSFLPPDLAIGDLNVPQYLARLAAEATTIINAEDYGRAIYDLAVRRSLIKIGEDVVNIAYDAPVDMTARSQIEDAEARLLQLLSGSATRERTDAAIGDIADRIVQNVENEDAASRDVCTPTGFNNLDRRISGGYRPGRLYVIAGRPGMGKSVFGVASSRRVARKGGGAAFYSLELDQMEIGARVMASELSMSSRPMTYAEILTGNLESGGYENIRWARDNLAAAPLHIDAAGGLSMHEIESRVRIVKDRFERAGTPLRVVYIDYLGLIKATDRYKGNKVHEMGEMALHAKTMAKRLGIAVVLLAQLSRSVEQRDVKRPFMSDLRDSGNIEEHADVVGLLYRPAYYLAQDARVKAGDPEAMQELADCQNTLDLDLGKNRLGPTGNVPLWCDVSLSAVSDRQM